MEQRLSLSDAGLILKLARESIEHYLRTGKKLRLKRVPQSLAQHRGVFVTIKKHGQLRGCIGFPYPVLPLADAVVDAAISSATKDPRFEPVSLGELGDLSLEVTILTAPRKLDVPKSQLPSMIKKGKHGLMVKKGAFSGLLLPQVAVEHGFDPEEFLCQTCIKAGLSPDAWLDEDTEVYIFEGQIFEEESPNGEPREKILE